ncbi:wax ester synthase/diacylglycerol acyltransferase 4-like [Euphorbia lathyris]|uniref:wax ester synthase/diacylglycerol acyltransferase 4-like n=1 Tax=Euphorbia lathyris TaxID=212925 RepID=UPI003313FEA1
MEFKHFGEEEDDEILEQPVSPTGQYFNSSALSVSVIAVLESEIAIDDSPTFSLLQHVFLPINPRFSSIMVEDKKGVKQWKRVSVNLKNHINTPIFPSNLSPKSYDKHLDQYISKISLNPFPQTQPLWEIHIIKYPTSNAAGNLIFKLHHALGDGFSLMGALLSCLQRVDNPSLPLTFPSLRFPSKETKVESGLSLKKKMNKLFGPKNKSLMRSMVNTMYDFGWGLLKSSVVEDDQSPIRSGEDGVEFKPIGLSTITFSLDHVKQIKAKLGVTINDVITGIMFYGIRKYMESEGGEKSRKENSTALVLLNTRIISGYKSVEEMVKPKVAESAWGNQFAFLHVSMPELDDDSLSNPLKFVDKAQHIIKRKRSSLAVNLTGKLLDSLRRLRGSEATAKYIHNTLRNSSMTISNVIGPVEQMALANHPVKGLYFMVVGVPQSLTITMMSYKGQLRIAVGTERDFINPQKFKSCIENAFEMIFNYSCM